MLTKWRLHRFYAKHPVISKHLPPTALCNKNTLNLFLDRYRTVFIKGSTQHTGKGIVKAWKTKAGYSLIKVRGNPRAVPDIKRLYSTVAAGDTKQTLLVQKGIAAARIMGRPFDLRVMMMRDGNRKWRYAGMVAKVNGQGSVISNVARGGGYVMSVEKALQKSLHLNPTHIQRIKGEVIRLSRTIMRYSEKYPFYSFQCGIDLAVDRNGKVWIIEVNLHNPSHGIFRRLTDKTYFRRVKKLYGSYRSKNSRLI